MDKLPRQNRIREALDRIYDQHPPQVREYVRRYQEDPKSRVFAPLAEAYRRLGRVDEALGLCLEGLEHHPEFHGGRVALAKCYVDKHQFEKARVQLEQVVQNVPENLLAQRILGDVLMALGHPHQGLHCYKMAAMLAPNDVALEEKIRSIEASVAGMPQTAGANEPVTPFQGALKPVQRVASGERRERGEHCEQAVARDKSQMIVRAGAEAAELGDVSSLWSLESAMEKPPQNSQTAVGATDLVTDARELRQDVMANDSISWDESDDFVEKAADSQTIEMSLSPGGADLEESFQIQNVSDLFRDEKVSPEITTSTLADLYLSQGQFEKSLLMYERLQKIDSSNESLKKKIGKCRAHLGVMDQVAIRDRKILRLKSVLVRVKSQARL